MGSSITTLTLVTPEEDGSSGTNGCEKAVVIIGIGDSMLILEFFCNN
jgi:hypothetical protein